MSLAVLKCMDQKSFVLTGLEPCYSGVSPPFGRHVIQIDNHF